MKKTLSILLAVLCVFMSLVPAFAADTESEGAQPDTEPATLYDVTFYGPVDLEDDAKKTFAVKFAAAVNPIPRIYGQHYPEVEIPCA